VGTERVDVTDLRKKCWTVFALLPGTEFVLNVRYSPSPVVLFDRWGGGIF
jgi:hypothetical protein